MTLVVHQLLWFMSLGLGLWGNPSLEIAQGTNMQQAAPAGKVKNASAATVNKKPPAGPMAPPGKPPSVTGTEGRTAAPAPRPAPPAVGPTPKGEGGGSAGGTGELPTGSILVPYEIIKDKIRPLPFYWVPAPVYQQMENRLRELERRLRWERSVQSCKLQGRLEGDIVVLQAELKLYTEQPQSRVVLGFQGAMLSADAELDEQLPLLSYQAEEGYVIEVGKVGWHRLVLPLKVSLPPPRPEPGGGGLERVLELGLPGAAVTTLVLELPAGIKELRSQGQVLRPSRPGIWELALGTARQLQLSWRELPAPQGGIALRAHWQVRVTLQPENLLTEAQLTLEDRRAKTGEWRLRLPAGALVRVLGAEAASYDVLPPAGKEGQWLLKGPASEHLEVLCSWRQAYTGRRLAVGPCQLLGAERQEGTIEIRAGAQALRGIRLAYFPASFTQQQDPPRESGERDVLARFTYTEPPLERSSNSPRPPLEIALQPVVALVEAAGEHRIHLTPTVEGWQVQVQSTFRVWPVHNGLDQVELFLPQSQSSSLVALELGSLAARPALAGSLPALGLLSGPETLWPVYGPSACQCERPAEARLEKGSGSAVAHLQLPQPEQQEFLVVLRSLYLLPTGNNWARLQLPRLLATLDRGAEVTCTIAEGYEVQPRGASAGVASTATTEEIRQPSAIENVAAPTVLRFAAMPRFVDLTWQSAQPRLPVQLLADVTVSSQRIQVREELRFSGDLPNKLPPVKVLPIRAPVPVTSLRLLQGGQFLDYEPDSGLAKLALHQEPLILEYEIPLANSRKVERKTPAGPPTKRDKNYIENSYILNVPIFWPQEVVRVQAKVRVWGEPGCRVDLPDQPLGGEAWQDRGPEAVADREQLPALVVTAEGNRLPLVLRWQPAPFARQRDLIVERGLVQVIVLEEEVRYRVRFLFSVLQVRELTLDFPMPLARLAAPPQIWLAGKQVAYHLRGTSGKTISFALQPEQVRGPVLLDIHYTLPVDTLEAPGRFVARLHPPRLPESAFVGRLRWQVMAPPGWLLLPLGKILSTEQKWVWRQGLLMPESATTPAELEAWLTGQESKETSTPGGVVLWATELEPVTCLRLPQLWWLGLCSGALLFLAVGLLALAPTRRGIFLLVGILGLGLLAAGLFWPSGLPLLVYGCEPGGLVLFLVLLVLWGLARRYHRQIVFLPSFSRARSSGAQSRGSGPRKGRETATVDAPALRGSSGLVQGSGS